MNLKAADITAQRVLLELARVGFSDIRKIVDADGRLKALIDLDDDTAAARSAASKSNQESRRRWSKTSPPGRWSSA